MLMPPPSVSNFFLLVFTRSSEHMFDLFFDILQKNTIFKQNVQFWVCQKLRFYPSFWLWNIFFLKISEYKAQNRKEHGEIVWNT